MTRDDAAPLPGDLLLQAVEGMERPLFVLDDAWRFRYVNPAGAGAARPHGRRAGRPGHLGGVPRGGRQPVRAELPAGRRDRGTGQLRGLVRAAGGSGSRSTPSAPTAAWWSPTTTSPQRRRTEEERAAAVARPRGRRRRGRARSGRGGGGRSAPDAARRHQPGDDLDVRHRRGGRPVRPSGRAAAGRLVPGERGRPRRHAAGTSAARTATRPMVAAMHRYADLRVALEPADARRCRGCCGSTGRWSSPTSPPEHVEAMVASAEARAALEPLQPRPSPRSPWSPAARSSVRSPWSTAPSAGRTPTPSCGRRRSPPAGPRSPWTTPGSPRPTSRWPSGCS